MDVYASPYVWNATTEAAGSVIAAMRQVLNDKIDKNEITNAFAAIRPPGHHASYSWITGFCFFNNVFIAVVQALLDYRKSTTTGAIERRSQPLISTNRLNGRTDLLRVLVVDWDLHSGDGSIRILEKLQTRGVLLALAISIY